VGALTMGRDANLATGIEWGVAIRTMVGEVTSGDLYTVTATHDGVLAAVIDGLGHGPDAAAAARSVLAELEAHSDEPLVPLVRRAHAASRSTRGVALSLASVNTITGLLTWLGVGNVEGIVVRPDTTMTQSRERLVIHNGVVGYSLPALRPSTVSLRPGDDLIFVTDGVHANFAESLIPRGSPQQIADHVLADSAKQTDDALALVVRYTGRPR